MTLKEVYFTPENIRDTAGEMLQKIEHIRKRNLPGGLKDKTALLILDMQAYFLDPGSHAFVPSAIAVIPGVLQLLEAFSKGQKLVIFSRHVNSSSNAKKMATWWKDQITDTDPLSDITPELENEGHPVIIKNQYDAFFETDLEDILKLHSIEQVVICGVMTHLCCETTARSAFMRGFDVLFTVDGTATYNHEFHQSSLLNLAHGFATPVLVNEVLGDLFR